MGIHQLDMSIVKTTFTELETGTEIKVMIRLSCSEFCDLRGKIIQLIDKNEKIEEIALTKFNGVENETEQFAVKTSMEPGEHLWTAIFA